ncbi:MAG: amidohydrolase family protein [Caldilineaceae bacterium]|nr:amidohydrolase family protein [Caldilineaceae bacterium]
MFEFVIRGGEIIDGSRARRFRGDVGIQGGRITAIGDLSDAEAGTVIDATGKIVAPGFVDTHNHSDAWLLKTPHLTSKTMQGFTTEVIMADGISYAPLSPVNAREWITYLRALNALRYEEYTGWLSLEEYMAGLDRKNVQNSIPHVPYANVRALAAGWGRAVPDDYQMRQIVAEVEKGMAAGAVGLSTGMDYIVQWFASTEELADACAPLVAQQGLYVTHMRYKRGTMRALKEAVEIGKRAGIPVHISHLKGTSPQASEEIISYIDNVARNEVSFSFDVYPYLPGSTMLNYWLPYEAYEQGPLGVLAHLKRPEIRAQMEENLRHVRLDQTHIAWLPGKENSHHQGKMLSDYIAEVGKPAGEALCDLLIEENLGVLLVMHLGDDELIAPFLAHDCYVMGSDGIYHEDGVVHPRQYGSAARLLGPAVRKGWMTLEDAVYKLSGHPAERFGLTERGQVRAGWWADLVVFDADVVEDRATYENPHQYAVGVEQVLVNGVRVIADGAPVDKLPSVLPGRALRFKQKCG